MTYATDGWRPGSHAGRPLRKDAERNRQLILQAAGLVFAEQGLDASFEEIARVAGVGVGTVYRRYPDRRELVGALFEQRIDAMAKVAEIALTVPDPWQGLCQFLTESTRMQVADRGLKEVLRSADGSPDRLVRARNLLIPTVDALTARAKADGSLRQDVEGTDLAVVTAMVSQAATPDEPDLWRRYLLLMLDGLRETRAASTPLPVSAPGDVTVGQLMEPPHDRRDVRRAAGKSGDRFRRGNQYYI